jgi:hypothetical protein
VSLAVAGDSEWVGASPEVGSRVENGNTSTQLAPLYGIVFMRVIGIDEPTAGKRRIDIAKRQLITRQCAGTFDTSITDMLPQV